VINIKKYISQIILIAVLTAGVSFFAGMKYQQSQGIRAFNRIPGRDNNSASFRQGFQPVNGEVVSLKDNLLTVKSQDGSSKIIVLSDSTKINLATTGSQTDLKGGVEVMITGTTNSDGSVTAQIVSVGSSLPGMGMPR